MRTIEERTKQCLAEVLGLTAGDIKDSESIVADLGADDIDVVEIAITLEEEFEIEVSDDEMNAACTVDRVIALVKTKTPNAEVTGGGAKD